MSEFLQQCLNDEEHKRRLVDARNRATDMIKLQQAFDNACNCGDFYTASELADAMRKDKEELIPSTPELNRLKEFLANFKRDPEDIGQNTPFPADENATSFR